MGRNVGRGGRSMVKSFSYPHEFEEGIKEIELICRREGKSFSDVLVILLKEYIKEHSQSQNPQTKITLFETGIERAMPNLYEIIRNPKKLDIFYNLIKKRSDFSEVDKGLNIWLQKHHKRDKEL